MYFYTITHQPEIEWTDDADDYDGRDGDDGSDDIGPPCNLLTSLSESETTK